MMGADRKCGQEGRLVVKGLMGQAHELEAAPMGNRDHGGLSKWKRTG